MSTTHLSEKQADCPGDRTRGMKWNLLEANGQFANPGILYDMLAQGFRNGFFAAVHVQFLVYILKMVTGSVKRNVQFSANHFGTKTFDE